MDIYQFMSSSPWFTFFLAGFVVHLIVSLYKIPFRHMNIRKHGWPPEHCDADEDFKDD